MFLWGWSSAFSTLTDQSKHAASEVRKTDLYTSSKSVSTFRKGQQLQPPCCFPGIIAFTNKSMYVIDMVPVIPQKQSVNQWCSIDSQGDAWLWDWVHVYFSGLICTVHFWKIYFLYTFWKKKVDAIEVNGGACKMHFQT